MLVLQLFSFMLLFLIRQYFTRGRNLSTRENNRLSGITYRRCRIESRQVGVKRDGGFAFSVRPEQWYHEILKKAGIATEISIPDTEFDNRYFIASDSPHILEKLLKHSGLMQSLKKLFGLPVESLHVTSKRIWCEISNSDLRDSDDYYEKHYEILESVAQSLSLADSAEVNRTTNYAPYAIAFVSVHLGVLAAAITWLVTNATATTEILDTTPWILQGMVCSGLLVFLWYRLIVYVFKNTSWVCWVFADFLLIGAAGFALMGTSVVKSTNIVYDRTGPTVYEQPIMRRFCTLHCYKKCGRRCINTRRIPLQDEQCLPTARATLISQKRQEDYVCAAQAYYTYNLLIRDWRSDQLYNHETYARIFDAVHVGQTIRIPVKSGALGLSWVDTAEILPSGWETAQ